MQKRNKVRKACDSCRKRKRGCDEGDPCGACVQADIPCTFNTTWASHPGRPRPSSPGTSTTPLRRDTNNEIRSVQRPPSATMATPSVSRTIPQTTQDVPRFLSPGVPGQNVGAGLFSEDTPRFVQRTSTVAFPRLVGLELKAARPPKLHSYAYNLGMRQEEISRDHGPLPINAQDVRQFAWAFFRMPIKLISEELFHGIVERYYQHPQVNLGVVVGGVFAIGSCLLQQGHRMERDVVHWCKGCLEDPSTTRKPTVQALIGWALRMWYLRMTTRPACAWLASCTAVHVIEAIGLHRQENLERLQAFSGIDEDALRLIFWTTYAAHRIISLEYARGHVELAVTTKTDDSEFLRMVTKEDLKSLDAMSTTDNLLLLTKADIAFAIYRRSWQAKIEVDENLLIKIGMEAADAAENQCLATDGILYFGVLSTTFQFACVLMCLRTPNSLKKLARVLEVLRFVANRVDTFMAQNALATVNSLVEAIIEGKRGELNELEAIRGQGIQTPAAMSTDESLFEFDWTQFDAEFADSLDNFQ